MNQNGYGCQRLTPIPDAFPRRRKNRAVIFAFLEIALRLWSWGPRNANHNVIGGRKVPKSKVGCDFKEGKKGRPIFFLCMSAVAERPVQFENAQACSHVCTFVLGLAFA